VVSRGFGESAGIEVMEFVEKHGRITRKPAAALCRISEVQGSRLLRKLLRQIKFEEGT
jgi:hypothetical protein